MATIFCFTSTGNSLFTAKRLAETIGGSVKPMNNGSIQCDDDVIGFVFPVFFWGLPRIVERFVSDIRITNTNAYIFSVATSGGSVFGVLGRIKKLLHANNIRLHYGARLVSVSNYLPEYTPKDSEKLRQKVDKRIVRIADAIHNRQSNRLMAPIFINKIAYRFYPDASSDQYFAVAPACTGCGICKQICPAKNISMNAGKPDFLHKCEHCLACVHHCPAHAIDWKERTQGKDRYRSAGVSVDELISFNRMESV